ncbi:unnamed protein product [Cochlearia groenlandica]
MAVTTTDDVLHEHEEVNAAPPDDDCCPICFSSFTVPCRGNCGHWYCGSCILQYWNYAAVSRPCKCPMCVQHITKLTPQASLQQLQEQEVKEVLAKIRRYNRLFVGGLIGFLQKVQELPLLMKRLVWHIMDPDTNNMYFHEVRILAIFMSTLYTAAEFNFIPTGGFRIVNVFDYTAIAMILILRLVGIYRRRRLAQRVRNLQRRMGGRAISQEAFDDLVRENVEDLGMEPTEALEDALYTLKLQGVDLSGIITESSVKDNPVIACLDKLKELDCVSKDGLLRDDDFDEISSLFDKLNELCSSHESGNVAIATKHGSVELTCSICSKIKTENRSNRVVVPCLKALAVLIHDIQSTEAFRNSSGPRIVVDLLKESISDSDTLDAGFAVVAAAVTGNEVIKELFMELKIDEFILQVLYRENRTTIQSLYDAIRVILTPDDNRVVASQVYGYARTFAKLGIARALTEALQAGIGSDSLVSASIALKSIAVNDEICKSIAESGGIDTLLRCIDDSGEQGNQTAAKTCCSLLSKLAGSDSNKSTIVEKRGLDKLIKLAQRFSDDPLVIQEVMSIIAIICLRSPDHAASAIEAGADDMAIQAMKRFPTAAQMQRNACNMIRNIAVRNAENRTILLANGIEKLIRNAKANNEICKASATDALRDLGLDNYNS